MALKKSTAATQADPSTVTFARPTTNATPMPSASVTFARPQAATPFTMPAGTATTPTTPTAATAPTAAPMPAIKPWSPTMTAGGQLRLTGNTTASKEASSLYVDPTAAYSPVLQFFEQQKLQANQRYKQNEANITTLFGALSGIATADQARINDQFTKSITEQQLAVAKRNAEAQTATNTGLTQMAKTGAERGTGDAVVQSPTQVATAEAAGRSNEYQTVWENLQKANQNQAVLDTQNRQAGYGQQQVGAISKLSQGLEDRLMEIGGNTAQVQSDIAKAKLGSVADVAQANYGEMQNAKDYQRRVAIASASASKPSAAKTKTYGKDYIGTVQYLTDTTGAVKTNAIVDGIDAVDAGKYTDWAAAYAAWDKTYGVGADGVPVSATVKARIKQYFQYNYGKPKASGTSTTTPTQ